MSTNYPASKDAYDPVPTSQSVAVAHQQRHQDIEDAMEAVQTFVGVTASTDGATLAGAVNQVKSQVSGLGLALNGTAPGGAVNQARTGKHFVQDGARINRVRDRLFISAGCDNDGAFPNVGRDWMSNYWVAGGFGTGPAASALFFSANDTDPNSAIGVLSAVQSKNFATNGTTALGVFGCVFNDNTTFNTNAYAGYLEAHRTTASARDTYGLEIDTRTLTATTQPTPRQLGDVVALQLASGAEWSPTGQFDASTAIQIAANPKKFKVGINVMYDSLVDIGGGITEVMNMNKYGLLSWFDATGARSGFVTSSAATAATGTNITLADNQINLASTSGALNFAFVTSATAANYLSFYSATAGNAVRVLAGGTDANIDVSLEPKGTGLLKVGTASAAATTPASFSAARRLAIKDSSGTTYYIPLATAPW